MITLDRALSRLQRKLGDEDEEVWSRSTLADFLQDGCDILCREAKPLFDMVMFTDRPLAANHTREWEEQYMKGMVILGIFGFTRESERDYVAPGTPGPSNHTRPTDAEYINTTDLAFPSTPQPLGKMPDGYVEVVRVTHDWLRLEPKSSRELRNTRLTYETDQSGVFSYSMDQDGYFNLRRVGVPPPTVETVEFSGVYGGIRGIDEYGLDTEDVIGTYGGLRQVPRHFVSGQYGGIRRIVEDGDATRVEFFRLNKELSGSPFEIPDRAVRYCEWWAMHRAYSVKGIGEDKDLANHYKARFQAGVQRIKDRVAAIMAERTIAIGKKRARFADSYLQLFPGDWGYARPYRR